MLVTKAKSVCKSCSAVDLVIMLTLVNPNKGIKQRTGMLQDWLQLLHARSMFSRIEQF